MRTVNLLNQLGNFSYQTPMTSSCPSKTNVQGFTTKELPKTEYDHLPTRPILNPTSEFNRLNKTKSSYFSRNSSQPKSLNNFRSHLSPSIGPASESKPSPSFLRSKTPTNTSEVIYRNPLVPTYDTNGNRRGKVLIINKVKFMNQEAERRGAEADEKKLLDIFKNFGFEVIPSTQTLQKVGSPSQRHTVNSSLYIQSICDVFEKHAKEIDVEDMLKIVNVGLSKNLLQYQQTSCYENRGFKRCFLNPIPPSKPNYVSESFRRIIYFLYEAFHFLTERVFIFIFVLFTTLIFSFFMTRQ